MKKVNYFLQIFLSIVMITLFFLMVCDTNYVYGIEKAKIDGYEGGPKSISGTLKEITDILATIAGFVCVFKLIQIGIMYMMTGANDKSNAKSAMIPWAVGAIICGGYVVIGNTIIGLIQSSTGEGGVLNPVNPTNAINSIGQVALNVIWIVASGVALGMLIYIGIKYMMSGAQGVAKVKNTLLPWLIGALIVSCASGVAQEFVNVFKSSSGG